MLSAVLYRSGRRREALERADEALEVAPAGAPWVEPLKQGAKKASEILLKSGGLKPPTDTSELKRILRARLAEVGKGQQTLARALGYGDRDLMKVYENGAALLDAGEPVRASRIFEGLVELDGGVPLFRLALATAREVFGDHKSAAIAYDEAVDAARVVPGGVDLLADALLRRARHRFKRGKRTAVREDLAAVDALPESALNEDLQSLKKSIEVALSGGVLQSSADPRAPDRPKHRKKKRKSGSSGLVGKSPTKPENPNG
jgi:hypothetical protein